MHNSFRILFFPILFFGFYLLSIGLVNYLSDNSNSNLMPIIVKDEHIPTDISDEIIIDSNTINKMYSEKHIDSVDELDIQENTIVVVNIKNKPINPSIINTGNEKSLASFKNLDLLENENFSKISKTKQDFIKTLLPLISYENQKILLERENLYRIEKNLINENTLRNKDLYYLKKIAKKYKVKTNNIHKIDLVKELLISVDIIPNSIVLAQAANESGWGKSRFAKDYNALFGEYTYDFKKGVIPLKREQGKTHLVKAFPSVNNSVESYFKNINTHYAYEKFRLIRQLMRNKNNFSKINLLVDSLDTYAEDEKYVHTISSIIESNKLYEFDILIYSNSRS